MRVLVLDGNENQAVACVRSLTRAGHHVVVGAPTSWSKAGWSRSCKGTFAYVSPQRDPTAFVRCIGDQAQSVPGTLVLPLTESTTLPLSVHRDDIFAVGGRLVLPPHHTVLQAFDKRTTFCIAQSQGARVPRTAFLTEAIQARQQSEAFPYPAVLKPCRSVEAGPSGAGASHRTGRPRYARSPEEFLSAFYELRRSCTEVMAQEFVDGVGVGYFALFNRGEVCAEFAHQRIRDVYASGSGSAVRKSVALNSAVRKEGLAILQALEWHGVAMVEFRLPADGVPVFLEVNGRFWNSLSLAVFAGVDFPALLAKLAETGNTVGPKTYREGLTCRWLLGDFRHLVSVWVGPPRGYPAPYPDRLRTLERVLRPMRGTVHDNFLFDDPLPELGDWLDFILHRIPEARKKTISAREDLHAKGYYSHS
jgi:predicted ATP-grasp superfamily ATP-dependent carboligase